MFLLSNQWFLKVFGRGDRQKDIQSREVGSPGERFRERYKEGAKVETLTFSHNHWGFACDAVDIFALLIFLQKKLFFLEKMCFI